MSEETKEHANLSVREIVSRWVSADNMNGQRMAAEIFNELPAGHPDNPYADEIRTMRAAGLID